MKKNKFSNECETQFRKAQNVTAVQPRSVLVLFRYCLYSSFCPSVSPVDSLWLSLSRRFACLSTVLRINWNELHKEFFFQFLIDAINYHLAWNSTEIRFVFAFEAHKELFSNLCSLKWLCPVSDSRVTVRFGHATYELKNSIYSKCFSLEFSCQIKIRLRRVFRSVLILFPSGCCARDFEDS